MTWQIKFHFFNYHETLFISRGDIDAHRQQTRSYSSSSIHLCDHPEPFANECCWVYLRSWDCTASCVAYKRSRRKKRLPIVRRGLRMGVCVYATAQDEGTVVAPMRLQSRANWTNKRLVASYCWRCRLSAIDGDFIISWLITLEIYCMYTADFVVNLSKILFLLLVKLIFEKSFFDDTVMFNYTYKLCRSF